MHFLPVLQTAMFDPASVVVGGVSLMVVVFGLTEFFKDLFNMSGKRVTVMAALLGAVVMVVYSLIGIVPEPFGQVVDIFFKSVTVGLSASGYYKFGAARLPKQE